MLFIRDRMFRHLCLSMHLLLLCLVSLSSCSKDKSKLVSVSVIFRHGDRTPVEPYPNDPYKNSSNWPVGFGQLTNLGKRQHFQLGKWFRERYDTFLTELYVPKDVYVTSTDMDRTLMSVESNLAGLFPPVRTQIWNKDLRWQPVPIHTAPLKSDNVLAMQMYCPEYERLLAELKASPRFVNINNHNSKLYSYLTKHSGKKIASIDGVQTLYNTLWIENLYNFTLPAWTRAVFPERLEPLASFSFAMSTFTHNLARLKVGPLLNKITHQIGGVRSTTMTQFMIYSAHDTTVAAVLNALDVFEYHCPPYGATILFEQRLVHNQSYVNIFYKNDTVPREVVLKGCEFDCPLQTFMKIVGPLRMSQDEWQDECLSLPKKGSPLYIRQGNFTILYIFIGILLITIVGMYAFYKKRQTTRQGGYSVLPNQALI